jgi:hypothetical protein
MTAAIWQGTAREYARLRRAVAHNCECLPDAPCAAHAMLQEQITLDHLLYVFRTRGLYVTRELYAAPLAAR